MSKKKKKRRNRGSKRKSPFSNLNISQIEQHKLAGKKLRPPLTQIPRMATSSAGPTFTTHDHHVLNEAIVAIRTQAQTLTATHDGLNVQLKPRSLTAVPYYTWGQPRCNAEAFMIHRIDVAPL